MITTLPDCAAEIPHWSDIQEAYKGAENCFQDSNGWRTHGEPRAGTLGMGGSVKNAQSENGPKFPHWPQNSDQLQISVRGCSWLLRNCWKNFLLEFLNPMVGASDFFCFCFFWKVLLISILSYNPNLCLKNTEIPCMSNWLELRLQCCFATCTYNLALVFGLCCTIPSTCHMRN